MKAWLKEWRECPRDLRSWARKLWLDLARLAHFVFDTPGVTPDPDAETGVLLQLVVGAFVLAVVAGIFLFGKYVMPSAELPRLHR